MPVHPIDFEIQAHIFSTPELEKLFDEKKRFERWLLFEATLAAVQGELGIIPREAAAEISSKARLECIDLHSVAAAYQQSRNSLLPVIKALRQACANGMGEYVHYGATTQDVLDTAHILEMKEVLQIIYRDLRSLEDKIMGLVRSHQFTPMVGRTHGQQALPITFGLKAAVWLSEIRRHIERLQAMPPRVLVGQLSGAVGTMAALGTQARQVAGETMHRLGLLFSPIARHTARDSAAEAACSFAMITATLEKIANEIFQLGKTEIAELAEPVPGKAMSSSTMPHKRNPVLCQRIAVLARHVRALSGLVVDGMVHEHERDARCLWSEWLAMPQISVYTGTALHYLVTVIDGLEVRKERMRHNLYLHKDMIISEWLLFRLGATLGRMQAQEKLHDLISRARTENLNLREALARDEETSRLLTGSDLEYLDKPELYIGLAVEIVNETLQEIEQKRRQDPEVLSV